MVGSANLNAKNAYSQQSNGSVNDNLRLKVKKYYFHLWSSGLTKLLFTKRMEIFNHIVKQFMLRTINHRTAVAALLVLSPPVL